MKNISIGTIQIGHSHTPLVIPEIGINHNGDLSIGKQMVTAAFHAGAKLIKHQTHIVSDEMSAAAKKVIPGNATISIYDIMAKCALNEEEEIELKRHTESLGMIFLSTPFSRAAAERLERMNVSAYKIGSGEMNNLPLLDYVASFGKPMIVSTGMNTIDMIDKAINTMEQRGVDYALMHTTNLYPTPPHLIRLGAMEQLMTTYPEVPIGLSDHSINNNACISAIALGATIVERHFTDRKDRIGPDIICSMDPDELTQLLLAAKEIPQMRGGSKGPVKEEQPTIDFAFATVVAIKNIQPGEIFTVDNIWVKRPGTNGILAEHYNSILGKRATCSITLDTQLLPTMIQD